MIPWNIFRTNVFVVQDTPYLYLILIIQLFENLLHITQALLPIYINYFVFNTIDNVYISKLSFNIH